jgi:hypothetical protein
MFVGASIGGRGGDGLGELDEDLLDEDLLDGDLLDRK